MAMDRRTTIVVVAMLLVPLGVLSSARAFSSADGYPEFSYREQVEPICRSMNEKAAVAVGPSDLVKFYPPARASAALKKAGRALLSGYRVLRAVEVPVEFQAQLGEWLLFVKATASRYMEAGRALAREHAAKAQHLLVGLEVPTQVQSTEDAFGFAYCKINPSQWVVPFRH